MKVMRAKLAIIMSVLLGCMLCCSRVMAHAATNGIMLNDNLQKYRIQAKKDLPYDVRAINKFIEKMGCEADDFCFGKFSIEDTYLVWRVYWVTDAHVSACDKESTLEMCNNLVTYADPEQTILANACHARYGLKIINESVASKRTKTYLYTYEDIMPLLTRCEWW